VRHRYVEQDAGTLPIDYFGKKSLGRFIWSRVEARRTQKSGKRAANNLIVVDNVYNSGDSFRGHAHVHAVSSCTKISRTASRVAPAKSPVRNGSATADPGSSIVYRLLLEHHSSLIRGSFGFRLQRPISGEFVIDRQKAAKTERPWLRIVAEEQPFAMDTWAVAAIIRSR
jgi:hypothetical protein